MRAGEIDGLPARRKRPVEQKESPLTLQISSRKSGDVVILDLQGRALIGTSNDDLGRELRGLIEGGARKILVNLGGVPQVDSSGISTIVRSFVTLRREGGSLKLLKPVGHVHEVLALTHLIQTIPTFQDEKAALDSFK
ncbi:MAG: STAS domain-containing protein [Candidatus Acidiferrales bacterium]